jgi:hypothetical protein
VIKRDVRPIDPPDASVGCFASRFRSCFILSFDRILRSILSYISFIHLNGIYSTVFIQSSGSEAVAIDIQVCSYLQ